GELKDALDLLGGKPLGEEVEEQRTADAILPVLRPEGHCEAVELFEDLPIRLPFHLSEDIWHQPFGGEEPAESSTYILKSDDELKPGGDRTGDAALDVEHCSTSLVG